MSHRKRLLNLLLVLIVVCAMIPLRAHAATSGDCGENVTWSLSSAGTLTISGTGPMADYSYNGAPWYESRASIKKVVINSGVTTVGSYAFYLCESLTTVTLPTTLTTINDDAFFSCEALTKITIPEGVTRIDYDAFHECKAMTSVSLPSTLTQIGRNAFRTCESLTSVDIPASVTKIDEHAFEGCPSLTRITVASGNPNYTSDSYGVLFNKNQTVLMQAPGALTGSYSIPTTVTEIHSDAFISCAKMTGITIPTTITSIPYGMFWGCDSLKSISIPSSVTTIGNYAFYSCDGLTSVTIPDTVTSLGNDMFAYCKALKTLTFGAGDKTINSSIAMECPALTTVNIPEGVTTIGGAAFYRSGVTTVKLPDSLTTISGSVFSYCANLTDITIPANVTSLGNALFQHSGLKTITFKGAAPTFGSDLFTGVTATAYYPQNDASWTEEVRQNYGGTINWVSYNPCTSGHSYGTDGICTRCSLPEGLTYTVSNGKVTVTGYTGSLTELSVPAFIEGNPVTYIGSKAFYNLDSLTKVTIPDSVTYLGSQAFAYCEGLTQITIPDSVTQIAGSEFSGCSALSDVTLSSNLRTIGASAFEYCSALKEIVLPDSVTSLGEYAFMNCSAMRDVTIGKGITTISKCAFRDCDALEDIVIPDTVTTVADYAFDGCDGLKSITFGKGLTSVGTFAFSGVTGDTTLYITDPNAWCNVTFGTASPLGVAGSMHILDENGSEVTELVLDDTVTAIPTGAFYGCTGLTKVTVGSNVQTIGKSAFAKCTGLTEITIPEGVTAIGSSAFSNCTKLQHITIPEGVSVIEGSTFSRCSSLISVTLPSSVTSITAGAFNSMDNLWHVLYTGTEAQWAAVTVGDRNTSLDAVTVCCNAKGDEVTVADESLSTCTDKALYVCSICDGILTEPIEGGEHDWVAATCTTPKTCDVCGETEGEALGHDWLDADCENPKHCSRCTATEGEAAHTFVSGVCSVCQLPEGMTYTITDDKVTVTGYTGSLTELTIPATIEGKPVTAIGDNAFKNCSSLTTITLPDTVTDIGPWAFRSCSSLTSIKIPDGVTSIGEYTFCGCSNLASITIPEGVTSIGDSAFQDCSKLTDITLPDTVTDIGPWAFRSCSSLKNIKISNSITKIGAWAFNGCSNLISVEIPNGVASIGNGAFSRCSSLTNIVIPNNVTSIGEYTFYGCSNLASIALSNHVTSIGNSAFNSCSSLTSITIPAGVTSIGDYAFSGFTNLHHVLYTGTEAQWDAITVGENGTGLENITRHCNATGNELSEKAHGEQDCVYCSACDEYYDAQWQAVEHSWVAADCETPKTCDVCGKTEGEANGHDWLDADCETPKTCDVCGKTEGEANGHDWLDADCETPKTCDVCGKTEGEANGHDWLDADCDTPKTCDVCGKTEGEANGHDWLDADCETPKTCDVCGKTEGEKLGHDYVKGTCSRCDGKDPDYQPVTITAQPEDAAVPSGQKATVTVKATGNGLKYTWYYKNPGASSFKKTDTFKGNTYTISSMDAARSGRQVYCKITDQYGNTVTTNTVTLRQQQTLTITTQPKNVTVASGQKATVTVKATGDGLKYEWYFANKGATKFKKTDTFKGNTYSISSMDATRAGRRVYCKITDKYGNSVTTNTVTLGMNTPLAITTQPKDVTVASGEKVKVTVQVAGDGLKYEWYFANKGVTKFQKTNTFKGNTYSIAAMDAARDGRRVYCKITDQYGNTVTTNTVTLRQQQTLTITAQPKNVTVASGQTAKVTVKASGDGLKYEWYFANKGVTKFKKTDTFKGNTYSISSMDATRAGRRVYCKITDKYGNSVTTNTVTLGMNTPLAITAQPKNVTVASGKTAKVTVKATGEGLKYEWYYANKGATKFTKTDSFTGSSYTVTMTSARAGRRVYCVITDKYGNTVKTDTVTLKMS